MNKKDALQNLKIVGWLLIILGVIAISGTIISWNFEKNIFEFILNIGFGVGLIYFGCLILFSRKTLS